MYNITELEHPQNNHELLFVLFLPLGLIIDEQLKSDNNNEVQCTKISKNIALLRRAK